MGGGVGIIGRVRDIISIVFVLFIESYPITFFPLPLFCWGFVDDDGRVQPKDSSPRMSCFKDMFKSSK